MIARSAVKKERLDSLSQYCLSADDSPDLDELARTLTAGGGAAGGDWDGLDLGCEASVSASPSRDVVKQEDEIEIKPEALGDALCDSPDSGFPDGLMEELVGDDFNFDFKNLFAHSSAEEPFTFLNDRGIQGLENGGQPEDTIKSDCMWSSSLDGVLLGNKRSKRSRDVSLTLSECADALFKDLPDSDLLDQKVGLLGTSPGVQSMVAEYMGDGSNEDDEEIDVVSDCDDGRSTCSSTTMSVASSAAGSSSSSFSGAYGKIRAGQSLLRNNRNNNNVHKPQQMQQQQQVKPRQTHSVSHQTILDNMNADHCYFATSPMTQQQQQQQQHTRGLLTPNESSDDDDEGHGLKTMTACRTREHNPREVLQQAAHSLSRGHQKIKPKFTFTLTLLNGEDGSGSGDDVIPGTRKRRNSAMKNQHCPSPPHHQKMMHAAPQLASSSARPTARPVMPPAAKARRTTSLLAPRPGETQKSRDNRDLHNSMERERRVNLRLNFEALRARVPDLESAEKASKLTILNKSAAFARQMAEEERRGAAQLQRMRARSAQLRRQLQQLADSFGATANASPSPVHQLGGNSFASSSAKKIVTASGRISMPNKSRHFF